MQAIQYHAEVEFMDENENTILLRETRDRVIRIDERMEIYLGKDGIVEELKRRVDGMHNKMLMMTGGGLVMIFLADKAWTAIFK